MRHNVSVKGWHWVNTKTCPHTGYAYEIDVVGINPSKPVEDGQRPKKVIWEPKVDEHGSKGYHKESVTRRVPYPSEWAHDGIFGVLMEGAVKSDCHKRLQPYSVGWIRGIFGKGQQDRNP